MFQKEPNSVRLTKHFSIDSYIVGQFRKFAAYPMALHGEYSFYPSPLPPVSLSTFFFTYLPTFFVSNHR